MKTTDQSADMMEVVRGSAANRALVNILAGVTSVHDRRSSSDTVSKTSLETVTGGRSVGFRR